LMVDVVLSQSGFDGQPVTLDVEDEGTLVSTQQVTLPDAGTPASIPVRFTVSEAGPRVLRFRVSPQPGELVTENNAREALIDVRDRKEKILYFEGEPRFEMKFIRRHPGRIWSFLRDCLDPRVRSDFAWLDPAPHFAALT